MCFCCFDICFGKKIEEQKKLAAERNAMVMAVMQSQIANNNMQTQMMANGATFQGGQVVYGQNMNSNQQMMAPNQNFSMNNQQSAPMMQKAGGNLTYI